MNDEVEVPFPADPECLLTWDPSWPAEATGWITFMDPKPYVQPDGSPMPLHRTSIPITRKPGGWNTDHPTLGNVWEFRDEEPGIITTHPSIHEFGRWHSANPTRWRVVENLADELLA